MGKSMRGHKEYTKQQELKHEGRELRNYIRGLEAQIREQNKEITRLRRQAAGSRKQLARMDLDRHGYIRDIVEEHLSEQKEEQTTTQMLRRLKEEWRCNKCNEGFLEIFTYNKMNETWYFRRCNGHNCNHRTKSQKYDSTTVRGIIKTESSDSK